MYLFIVLFTVLILWSLGIFILKKNHIDLGYNDYSDKLDYGVSKVIIGAIGGLFIFIILVSNLVLISEQKSDLEEVKKIKKQREILEKRYNNMSVLLSSVLVDKYPDMEKEIFNNMNKDNTLFFVKYPELRSSETMINYSNKILELKDDIYNKDLRMEEMIKDIKYRKINPWFFNFIIPDYND